MSILAPKFDVIIIDACYNDPNDELICPVEVFRNDDIASHVKRNLAPTGKKIIKKRKIKSTKILGTLSMNSYSDSNHTDGFQKVNPRKKVVKTLFLANLRL